MEIDHKQNQILSLGTIMEENIAKYRRNIADISCIGRRRHDIWRRKIGGGNFAKNRQLIGDILPNLDKSAIFS